MSVTIEGGQVAGAAVKGVLLQTGGWGGTIILFMADWSQTITAMMGMASFLMSVWYFRKMVEFKRADTAEGLIEHIRSATKQAPSDHKDIFRQYFDI